jgi:hypothetical protein
MSAYIVHEKHILALVRAATQGRDRTFRWFHNDRWHELERFDNDRATEVGQMLWDANARSVDTRYGTDDGLLPYTHNPSPHYAHIEPVAALKAIDGYEYQSCEVSDWEETEAYAFVNTLRRKMIHALPGYDDANWAIAA